MAKSRPFTSRDPRCRKGRTINFKIPDGAPGAGTTMTGIVRDCVRSTDDNGNWGTYRYFAELIEWQWGLTIRLSYWRKKPGEQVFGFGGQHSISANPAILKQLVDGMQKNSWF